MQLHCPCCPLIYRAIALLLPLYLTADAHHIPLFRSWGRRDVKRPNDQTPYSSTNPANYSVLDALLKANKYLFRVKFINGPPSESHTYVSASHVTALLSCSCSGLFRVKFINGDVHGNTAELEHKNGCHALSSSLSD